MAWSGNANGPASLLFNVSVGVLGLSQVPCYLLLAVTERTTPGASWMAGGFGLVSACGVVGYGTIAWFVASAVQVERSLRRTSSSAGFR